MPSKRIHLNSLSSAQPSAFHCQKKKSPFSPWLTAILLFAFLLASRDPPLFSLKVVFNMQHPQWPTLYGLCFLMSPCSQIFRSACFPKLQRSPETLVTTLGVVVIGLIAMFLCSIFHHCHPSCQGSHLSFTSFIFPQWQYIFLFSFIIFSVFFKDSLFLAFFSFYLIVLFTPGNFSLVISEDHLSLSSPAHCLHWSLSIST